ncbi:phage tail protein [Streptosporangium nondiastaticum]|uniref:Phage tail protein n=1 Tax=Streptosporangium nondiastaticum TaxID=35764 RepID=A0A9X7JTC8_9ACTN|nr:phage tail protein [Streptosporangium nondiastaticum]PSJ29553.1 phage tail protein [Streptosporangium nondiastaticum]
MGVGDAISTDVFAVDLGKLRVATYQGLSGLSFGSDAIEVKSVTPDGHLLTRKNPVAEVLPHITLTRPMDQNPAWIDWVKQTAAGQGGDSAPTNISISLLDGNKAPVRRVNLINAWASSWSGPTLQAGNTDPAIEKVTITYEDMTIE